MRESGRMSSSNASSSSSPLETLRGAFFVACGLEDKTAVEALSKTKLADSMESIFWEAYPENSQLRERYNELANKADVSGKEMKEALEAAIGSRNQLSNTVAKLLFEAAGTLKDTTQGFRPFLVRKIVSGDLANKEQVMEAVKYLNKLARTKDAEIDEAEFDSVCGVGIEVSNQELEDKIDQIIEENKETLLQERYLFPYKSLIFHIRDDPRLKWGDKSFAVSKLQEKVEALLGPKTEEDEKAAKEKKGKGKQKGKGKGKEKDTTSEKEDNTNSGGDAKGLAEADSFVGRDLAAANNSKELKREHAQITGGVIRTRFPPEPNGFLHIGHAKSMNLNFYGVFKALGMEQAGHTLFRYDDTNPEAETNEYIDSQAENVAWLGWKPYKVTHSSDYFDELYRLARELIKRGKAFVCHQTAEEVKKCRDIARSKSGDPHSPWRDRPIEESLIEFEKMKMGIYGEGEATLRMKIDMTSPNPCMWDPVAYRIKYVPHAQTGKAWCIYPSYDFTHCLIDSLEHIDYSLCTLEFEVRRDSYYWLLEALDLWRPMVWEFSRLNLTHTVLSKRKILRLKNNGVLRGWDDPRILTINGLRRRGYTPKAINDFCQSIGVTRKDNVIQMELLEHCCRNDLDANTQRRFGVLRPLKLVLTNVADDYYEELEVSNHPKDSSRGSHKKPISKVVYIDEDDFREEDSAKFFGLAPNKMAGLRYAGNVVCRDVIKDDNGRILEIRAEYCADRSNGKPKGNLHWISSPPGQTPATAEMRIYDRLFTHYDPANAPGNWEDYINYDSELVLRNCFIDRDLVTAPVLSKYQLERVGYFCKDVDSTEDHPVFNLTVSLKESTEVKNVKGNLQENTAAAKHEGSSSPVTSPKKDRNTIEPYARIDLRVGKIQRVWDHPSAEKLFCEEIDIGEDQPRTICSGIADHYTKEDLQGRLVCVVANLKPRAMRGVTSAGMVLCASDSDRKHVELIEPPAASTVGERISAEGYTNDEPDEEVNPAKKKNNPWIELLEHLQTSEDCSAMYKDKHLCTRAGTCRSKTLASSTIS